MNKAYILHNLANNLNSHAIYASWYYDEDSQAIINKHDKCMSLYVNDGGLRISHDTEYHTISQDINLSDSISNIYRHIKYNYTAYLRLKELIYFIDFLKNNTYKTRTKTKFNAVEILEVNINKRVAHVNVNSYGYNRSIVHVDTCEICVKFTWLDILLSISCDGTYSYNSKPRFVLKSIYYDVSISNSSMHMLIISIPEFFYKLKRKRVLTDTGDHRSYLNPPYKEAKKHNTIEYNGCNMTKISVSSIRSNTAYMHSPSIMLHKLGSHLSVSFQKPAKDD